MHVPAPEVTVSLHVQRGAMPKLGSHSNYNVQTFWIDFDANSTSAALFIPSNPEAAETYLAELIKIASEIREHIAADAAPLSAAA